MVDALVAVIFLTVIFGGSGFMFYEIILESHRVDQEIQKRKREQNDMALKREVEKALLEDWDRRFREKHFLDPGTNYSEYQLNKLQKELNRLQQLSID